MAGKLTGSISYCYFVGDVRGGTYSGALAGNLDSGGINRIFGSFAIPLTNGTSASAIGRGSSNSLLFVKLVRRTVNDFCFGTDTDTCYFFDPTDVGEFHGSGFEFFDYENTWSSKAGDFPTLKKDSLTKANSPALIPFEGEGTFDSPYQISSIADWNSISDNYHLWHSHFILTADLNFNNTSPAQILKKITFSDGTNDLLRNVGFSGVIWGNNKVFLTLNPLITMITFT